MQTLSELNQPDTEPIALAEEEHRHTRRLLIGILCALILTGSVLGGYMYLRKRHERQVAEAAEAEKVKKATPKVQVLVDDAMVEGKMSLLAGTINNISNETLHNVAVELQLRKRPGGGLEQRVIPAEATELAPGASTRYSVQVAVSDYTSATFSRVLAGNAHEAIAFKAAPGAARPPMDAPASKTVVVGKPGSRGAGEEFLNTEKNPAKVP